MNGFACEHALNVYLASGAKITVTEPSDEEPEEFLSALHRRVSSGGWIRFNDHIIHTGAISAIEMVESLPL